ncbi:MAG: hypothetical protein IJM30_06745 [Thermoguttaceae bacterium]|nr:hypothetical protein [Thermoguttaceae bacterium]
MTKPKKNGPSEGDSKSAARDLENRDASPSYFSPNKSGVKYSSRHDEFFKRSVENERICADFMATALPPEFGSVAGRAVRASARLGRRGRFCSRYRAVG